MDDVLILGAGSAGIAIAQELTSRDIPVTVVDESPIAAYSSTKNQGWLHSGALFAANGATETARACQAGAEAMATDFPDAIHTDVACHFLFESGEQRDLAVDRIRGLGIEARGLSRSDYAELVAANPALEGSPLRHAAWTPDRPVDTSEVLRRQAARAACKGARFQQVRSIGEVEVRRHEAGWRVSLGGDQRVHARLVVAAAGPCVGTVVEGADPGLAQRREPTTIPVCTLSSPQGPLLGSILAAPFTEGFPNAVPFRGPDREGVTMCLARADEDCDHRAVLETDTAADPTDAFEHHLATWLPGLRHEAARRDIHAHFYTCQKLKGASRGRTLDVLEDTGDDGEIERRMVAVYPGKFTAAQVVARECADLLESWTGAGTGSLPPSPPPQVARQRFFDTPHYRYGADGAFEAMAR